MNCYNLHEHLSCINYDTGEHPMIDDLQLSAGQSIKKNTLHNKLALVIKGKINYSYSTYAGIEIKENNLFFMPSGYDLELNIVEDTLLILVQISNLHQLCDRCQLEQLLEIDCEINFGTPYQLPFNERIDSYINSLLVYIGDGLRCYYFHELKVKELFYIFRLYYSKEEMKRLFNPLLTNDLSFSELVLRAATRARSVKDLADAAGYSVSGFSKRFRKVFNEPAYHWLQLRRAEFLYKQINRTNLPLKELVEVHGFANSSELNKFCKRYYGNTPYYLRKNSDAGRNTQ